MPTYSRNVAYLFPVCEHGLTIWDATVETEKVMTEATIPYGTSVGSYTLGEEITETTSGETGNVYWDDGSTLGLINVSGDFVGGKNLTGTTSGKVALGGVAQNKLTRTADTPIAESLLHLTQVTSTGTGDDKTVALDARLTWVMITNITGANVTINNEASGNTIAFLRIGSAWSQDMRLLKNASKLVLVFDAVAACTADIYQFKTDQNPLA